MTKCLITGGAGFIGSNLCRELVQKGYEIIVMDNLSPQIHGEGFVYQNSPGITFIKGDVRNQDDWYNALQDVDIIVHLAAETGTGQSMYEVYKYSDVNVNGTAIMLDYLVNRKHKIRKVIVASSRAIYGEGKYNCEDHGVQYPESRSDSHLANGQFEPLCTFCNKGLSLVPTDEDSLIHPSSVYGITKQVQEQMVLNVCKSTGIDAVALRYQNVYGPGQSLKNPYTGILSIFSTQIRNGNGINIFEDGKESRDFVFINDVVRATRLAVEWQVNGQYSFNIGSGVAITVLEVAEKLKSLYGSEIPVKITGNYRKGDIRHNVADLTRVKEKLGFEPEYTFDKGISLFVKWVLDQEVFEDRYLQSIEELKGKGLIK